MGTDLVSKHQTDSSDPSHSNKKSELVEMLCQNLSTSSTTSIMRSTFIRSTSLSSSSSRSGKCRPDPKFKWKIQAKLRPIIHRWHYRQSGRPDPKEKTSKVVPVHS